LLGKRPEGIKQQELIRVPMALVVPQKSRILSAEMLWQRDRISEPLIAGGADDPVYRLFQGELQKRKVEWFASMELNSQELIARYVAEGFGIGLVLVEPGVPPAAGIRVLPLADFPLIPYGLLWMGVLSPLQGAFIDQAKTLAAALSSNATLRSTGAGKNALLTRHTDCSMRR
jgi:DNA-binding transcriptional LysR family regulator